MPEDKIEQTEPAAADQEAVTQATNITLTDEELVALCKERVCSLCDEKEQADDQRLRSLAEMDNFKKRLMREQEEFRKYAVESVLADLVPVLDNLDLALEHGRKLPACKDVVLGVDMTRKVFLDTLKQHGLEVVGEVGQPFNPELHEAVGSEPSDTVPEGCVSSLMQRGYVLRDRLLRPAKVLVSKPS